MGRRERWWMLVLVALGLLVCALATSVACGEAESDPEIDLPSRRDAGASAPLNDASASSDGRADVDSGTSSIWAFNGYCDSTIDGGCGPQTICPSFDDGPGGRACATALLRCVTQPAPGSRLLAKVFACEPTGVPVWDLNGLCSIQGCDGGTVCPVFDAGVAGQTCPVFFERCVSGDKIFVCQIGSATVRIFDGYCDAGTGIGACNPTYAACTGAGAPGRLCDPPLERCVSGDKIFICAER
jgi:hypothetical protein